MPILYLFVGYPGAGKTTVANYICESTGAFHIWADRERHNMFPNPTHSAEESLELYRQLNDVTQEMLASGSSVVFDTNFNFRKDRDHLRAIAAEAGATVCLIWMKTDETIARERALHNDHAERNGYSDTMTAETFERIVGHLEPPTDDEHPVVFNGVDLDKAKVLTNLHLV
jgi:predicted kinase